MDYKKYLIKKEKLDLLSALKLLDKKIIDEKLKEYGLKNINELKDYIIEEFETSLSMSKDDEFTQLYFIKMLENEDSPSMALFEQDIKDLYIFVYKNEKDYSYYIPIEIKAIITKMLKEMSSAERINLRIAINAPIIKDLKELLNKASIKDLKHIGDLFLINRLSNKPKKELVNIIYHAITNQDKLTEAIGKLIDKEFKLLKELIKNKGTIQNNKISIEEYYYLYMIDIVSLFKKDNKFYISMTDDVYKIIKKMDLNIFEKTITENTKAYNLVRAMTELYGCICYEELNYYYSLYYGNGEKIDIPKNTLFCDRYDNIVIIHTDNNLYFVNSILDNEENEAILEDIISRQKSINRKPIKIDDLLKYLDGNYYEDNDSKRKFKKYLAKKGIQDEKIEEIILIISKMYRLSNMFINSSFNMLENYGLEITENNMQEILNYLTDIYNNTRIWSNSGWTPIEMRKEYK